MHNRYDLFISYSRQDDEPFVKQLCDDLISRGFNVWWDRICMPSRGLGFLQEIRDAIEASDRLLAVVGPNAVESDYVRAEWEWGLMFGCVVIPILRVGEYKLLPDDLTKFHCLDFRSNDLYNTSLKELIRILNEPILPLGPLYNVPMLPPHFLPRSGEIKSIADKLLADTRQPVVITSGRQVCVLHGMVGVGKSVLAAAYSRTIQARRAFSDGIIWLTIGQQPRLIDVLGSLLQTLGDDRMEYVEVDHAAARLFEVLADKRFLMVVDDIWNVNHAQPMVNALGPRCRLLVTTRDRNLIRALGAVEYHLDVLEDEEALKLLAEWAMQPKEQLPAQAYEVVRECGNLPLTLSMIGAMVQGHPHRWTNVLHKLRNADLEKVRQQFPNYPYPNLLRAMQVSVEALNEGLQERYLDFAVFPENSAIPEAVFHTFWQPLGLDQYDIQDLIDTLVDRSLVRRDSGGHLMLHDLHMDYVRGRAHDLKGLHCRLLDAYWKKCSNWWPSGPNDGYFFKYLTYHMIEADQVEELHKLLRLETSDRQNAWFEAKQAIADTAGYLGDIQLAWGLAQEAFPCEKSDAAPIIGLQYRYALITASLTSLARNLPPKLLAALVGAGILTPKQGITYTLRLPESKLRAKAVAELAPYLPEPIMQQALTVARAVENDSDRALALVKLSVHLRGPLKKQVIDEVLKALEAVWGANSQAEALAQSAPYLAEQTLHQVLFIARAIKFPEDREKALAGLIPHLKEPLRSRVQIERLETARVIDDRNDKAAAMGELVTDLEEPLKSSILREALTVILEAPSDNFKMWGIKSVAPHLPLPMLNEALAIARSIRSQRDRGRALAGLAPYFPVPTRDKILWEAISTARTIRQDGSTTDPVGLSKVEVLVDLVPHLSETLKDEMVSEGLAGVESIWGLHAEIHRMSAIKALAPHLSGVNLLKALALARTIENNRFRINTLVGLVPHLPQAFQEEVLREALESAKAIQDEVDRPEHLEKIVSILPKEMLPEAFRVAQVINDGDEVALTMAQLAPHLSNSFAEDALTAVLTNCRAYSLVKSIMALVPELPESQRLDLAKKALEAVGDIEEWETNRREGLAQVVSLAPELLPQVTEMARSFSFWHSRAEALTMIAAQVEEPDRGELLAESLAAAQAERSFEFRDSGLADIAVALAKYKYTKKTLSAIKAIESELTKVNALVCIAPHLPKSIVVDILKEAEKIEDDGHRAEALAGLVQFLPESIKAKTLQRSLVAAETILLQDDRALALARMVPHLSEPLKSKTLREALKLVDGDFVIPDAQVKALTLLVPYLSGDLLEEALKIARGIKDWNRDWRIKALLAVAPGFPLKRRNEIFIEAFGEAMAYDKYASVRSELLGTVAQHLAALPLDILYSVWCDTIKKLVIRTREDLLADLRAITPLIVAIGGTQVVSMMFNALQDVGRWWA